MTTDDLEQRVSALETETRRLQNILYSLGEVLRDGTTGSRPGWNNTVRASHFDDGELDKILYNLGEVLSRKGDPDPWCPPWCGRHDDEETPPETEEPPPDDDGK